MKRKMVERKCPECFEVKYVRADGVGKFCSSCRAKLNNKNRKCKEMIGFISGKLTVLSLSHLNKIYFWNCVCDCGNECCISGSRLRNKKTQSCGCIVSKQNGLSYSATYRSWKSMLQRCYDKNVSHYKRYGFKGIKVCERWKESFQNFLTDMGERPTGKTLERIDFNGNYETDNCEWKTPKEQANNKKSNFKIECFGQIKTLTQWSEEYRIPWSTLRKRIITLNWPIEKALTKKVGKYAIT
jgi:hypothetical protein